MGLFIGIDVGGTFTDFLVMEDGEARVFKVLSTPDDPSIGLMDGLGLIASSYGTTLERFLPAINRIVHGTTVTTNVVLTSTGAKTALLTTDGVRDALEMRRGIREEQYNNRFTNVPPLVPRYLRVPVKERIDAQGEEITPLDKEDVKRACSLFKKEKVESVAVCYMNAFANPDHERETHGVLVRELPSLYHSISVDVLPSIRFYERVSTTVLNAYVGPVLRRYIEHLVSRLEEKGFRGTLLIMQSNGGVVTPQVVTEKAAMTILSGPAAGPSAGVLYASSLGLRDCITVDMGGTSFDVALIKDLEPLTITEGEINRYRLALPMMGIVTIGAGGGSIGWIDEGDLLRVGPGSAGADPGPACYGKGGVEPTCTDADLVLGYLDPDYFAGGAMQLDERAARVAIEERIAKRLGMSIEEASFGMYRVINTNMAFGVREATIKRGYDPREFPMVVAGGAGPIHACMIASELEMPFFIVPRESSIFCAAGMLMTDLKHDLVKSFVSRWDLIDPRELRQVVRELIYYGHVTLHGEGISDKRMAFEVAMDMRYAKQYHEVSITISPVLLGLAEAVVSEERRGLFTLAVSDGAGSTGPGNPGGEGKASEKAERGGTGSELGAPGKARGAKGKPGGSSKRRKMFPRLPDGPFDLDAVLEKFHAEHNRLFGYSLEEEGTPVELINVRLRAIGETERPVFLRGKRVKGEFSGASKGKRRAFVPERGSFEEVPVYDALKLGFGALIDGPALLEQPNTTIFVSGSFNMVVDELGSYVVYAKGKETSLPQAIGKVLEEVRRGEC